MDRWSVRLRMLLEDYFVVIVVALLALALAGAYFSYAPHVDPGTETEVVEDARWSSSGQYSHQATVLRDTQVFTNGTVLRPTFRTPNLQVDQFSVWRLDQILFEIKN